MQSTSQIASELIDYLSDQNRYVSLKELENHFQVSKRTIFYRIKKSNSLLKGHNISEIKNTRQKGYILDQQASEKWRQIRHKNKERHLKSLSKTNRIYNIIWQFLITNSSISINDLSLNCNVSRNTTIDDLKFIKTNFPQLKLNSTNNGHILMCSENEKRRFVFQELQKNNSGIIAKSIDQLMIPLINKDKVRKEFRELEDIISSKFTENSIERLIRTIGFTIYRISLDKKVYTADIQKSDINDLTPKLVSGVNNLLNLNGIVDQFEKMFFLEFILCSQVESVNFITNNFKEKMISVTKSIIYRYNQISGINIKSEKFISALSNHLYATYFRCRFNFEFKATVLKTIKMQFPEMIKFVEISCSPLAKLLGKPIPINEIALICLYFISYKGISNDISEFLSKTDDIKDSLESDVFLVCSSGVGSSAILYSTLHKKYPLIRFSKSLSLTDLDKIIRIPNKAKLVITTAPINVNEFDIPIVQVQSLMNTRDSYKVDTSLKRLFPRLSINEDRSIDKLIQIIQQNATIHDKQALATDLKSYLYPYTEIGKNSKKTKLSELISPNKIKIFNKPTDLFSVIKNLCEILEAEGSITQDYFIDIKNLINKYGPYMLMSSNTFLAHAKPSSHTKKVSFSIAILTHPIKININERVEKISCVIVMVPGYHHEHDSALAHLINVITSPQIFNEIVHERNSNLIYRAIKTNSD